MSGVTAEGRPPVSRGWGRMIAVLAAAVVLAVSGCSYQTAGAPKGDLTLTATFTDVQQLVAGHSVKMSDITVGSVMKVGLVKGESGGLTGGEFGGYKSKVTLSIEDGFKIPQGTLAEIKVTSLLGENYVDLRIPPGRSMNAGPFLADGAAIGNTSVQPSFEQVVGQAGPLIEALAGDDVATVVNAGATALEGNGEKLNKTIAQAGGLLKMFADQRRELGESVDRFARLGRSLAKGRSALDQAPGRLERTTRLLDDNKNEIVKTVDRLTHMARQLNDKVLERRIGRFRALLQDLDPVLQELAGNRKRLTDLVNGLVTFTDKLPKASYDGQLLLYPILQFAWPDGSAVIPGHGPNEPASTSTTAIPKELKSALPGIENILEPRR